MDCTASWYCHPGEGITLTRRKLFSLAPSWWDPENDPLQQPWPYIPDFPQRSPCRNHSQQFQGRAVSGCGLALSAFNPKKSVTNSARLPSSRTSTRKETKKSKQTHTSCRFMPSPPGPHNTHRLPCPQAELWPFASATSTGNVLVAADVEGWTLVTLGRITPRSAAGGARPVPAGLITAGSWLWLGCTIVISSSSPHPTHPDSFPASAN